MAETAYPASLLTLRQVAARLGVSEKTARHIAERGLPAVQVAPGTAVRIDPDELERWLYADVDGFTSFRPSAAEPAAPLPGPRHDGAVEPGLGGAGEGTR